MTMTPEHQTMTSSELTDSLTLIDIKPGMKFPLGTLRQVLPDVETLLFFCKVFDLDYVQTSSLMARVLNQSSVVQALTAGDHSTDLQDYILAPGYLPPSVTKGQISFDPTVPKGEVLPELWRSLEVEVAQAIKDVGSKLASTFGLMPGKQGEMVVRSMMQMNVRRPTIGTHKARIHHAPVKENLVIVDDSGSVNAQTITAIVEDCVGLAYMANAHLALVSSSCRHWEPGNYSVSAVLAQAEYGGTQYETLGELMNRDWGVVVTIADYDGSPYAAQNLADNCTGMIDQLFDISLVNQPTFLAQCVGQFAKQVRPLLIGNSNHVLR